MIKAEGLTKDYGSRRAIDHLNFQVRKGEVLGFLGPNGAGKTTTMRILCGYMPPTRGSAKIAGYDVVDQSLEVRKRVGYVPETIPLYPEMTVYEYLKYMADLRHLPKREVQVENVLGIVHMESRANGYISNLSRGMRQRVGLAQALLHKPDVLILDEPTIGLDPAQIKEVRDLITSLGEERTILLSTHILSEAQQVCDRVLIINNGQIVAEDTPERLQSRLAGSQRFKLSIKGDTDGLEELIEKVSGVAAVRKLSDGSFEIESLPGNETRPDVARAVIKEGYDLLEIHMMGKSLEDVFLELTRDEPLPPEVAEHYGDNAD